MVIVIATAELLSFATNFDSADRLKSWGRSQTPYIPHHVIGQDLRGSRDCTLVQENALAMWIRILQCTCDAVFGMYTATCKATPQVLTLPCESFKKCHVFHAACTIQTSADTCTRLWLLSNLKLKLLLNSD